MDIDKNKNTPNEDNGTHLSDWEKEREKLLKHNEEVLNEKRKSQAALKSLEQSLESIGGMEGVEKLKELQAQAETEKQKQLMSEGRFDEMLKAAVAQQQAQFDAKLTSLNEEKEAAQSNYETLQKQLRGLNVNNAVKTISQNLNLQETAYYDIALHVMNDCAYDDNNTPIFLDENGNTKFNKQGDKYTIEDYINGQRKVYRHWEKPSNNGFGKGSQGGSSNIINLNQSVDDLYDMAKRNK
jgi:hypothetical protein